MSIITGRSQEDGKKAVEEITSAGGRAEHYPLDVTDEKRISSIYGIIGAPDLPAYHATKAANRVRPRSMPCSTLKTISASTPSIPASSGRHR